MVGPTWSGSQAEAAALLTAVQHHCTCRKDARGALVATCPPHQMLVSEQRALDGLVWMHRMVERLRAEEFHVTTPEVVPVVTETRST